MSQIIPTVRAHVTKLLSILQNFHWNSLLTYKFWESNGRSFLLYSSTGWIIYWFYSKRARKHPTIPCFPQFTPYFGHFPWLIRNADHTLMDKIANVVTKEMGEPRVVWLSRSFFPSSVLLLDPKLIDYCFREKFDSFKKGEEIHDKFEELLGNGIFASDGKIWSMHRKIASRMFSMRNLKNYIFDTAYTQAIKFVDKIDQLTKNDTLNDDDDGNGNVIDIYELLACYTLDTFFTIGFGNSLGIIDELPNIHPFMTAFDTVTTNISERFRYPFFKLRRYLNIGLEKQLAESIKILNQFSDTMINDLIVAQKQIESENGSASESETEHKSPTPTTPITPKTPTYSRQRSQASVTSMSVSSPRMELTDESGLKKHNLLSLYLTYYPNMSKKELQDAAMNMILAGRDTTRSLLSWFLFELSDKPEIEQKIVLEIKRFDAKYKDSNGNTTLTSANLQNWNKNRKVGNNFEYLECCLLETLRLNPSAPYLVRYAKERVDLPGDEGYYIEKGNLTYVGLYTFARMKSIWGENASIFDPSRFAKNGVNTYPAEVYPWFNLNPRMCLGKNIALMEAKIVAIEFLRKYKYQVVDRDSVRNKFAPTLNMENGLKIRIFPRNS